MGNVRDAKQSNNEIDMSVMKGKKNQLRLTNMYITCYIVNVVPVNKNNHVMAL